MSGADARRSAIRARRFFISASDNDCARTIGAKKIKVSRRREVLRIDDCRPDNRLRWLHRASQTLGLAAAIAGSAKKIVASKLQKIPIAQAMPSPLNEGLRAQPNEPNPLTAVSPARMTGLITPATSCSNSRVFCQTNTT